MEEVYRLAFNFEKEKHCCSQCTVAALQEVFQIKSEELFPTSFAFGGGFANTSEGTCGALRFVQEYGSCLCKDVQKKIFGRSFNFWDEKEKEIFEKSGGI